MEQVKGWCAATLSDLCPGVGGGVAINSNSCTCIYNQIYTELLNVSVR